MFSISRVKMGWMAILATTLLAAAAAAQTASTPKAQTASAPKAKEVRAAKTEEAPKAQESSAFKTPKEKQSYAIGMDLGNQLRRMSIDVDPDVFSKGLKDSVSGSKTMLTEEEARAVISEIQAEAKRKIAEARKSAGADNKTAGEAFLAQNKNKEGIVTLPSGLQYKVLKAGEGIKPTLDDTVVCGYRGTLIDGTEFDSSYKRNQPATFPVKGVIKGWTEALQLMPVGSKWELFVPPDLAYGDRGAGDVIGPDATLVFEVELLSIQAKK
ncbi:MAG TPA: FKBP-type peptidyl-prolyl cis-trans isomerase [Terriglobales bacterium]|nr:FKBP-type peptidyl-prolyl cis-trans isomerase [Terriglobales bacterium]